MCALLCEADQKQIYPETFTDFAECKQWLSDRVEADQPVFDKYYLLAVGDKWPQMDILQYCTEEMVEVN